MPWRFYVVGAFCVLLGFALLGRLSFLQVLDNAEFLQDQGERRTLRAVAIPAHRGAITDRNGEPLAVSTPVVSLWADPRKIDWTNSEIARLAKAMDIDFKELKERIERNQKLGRGFMYLRRRLSPSDADAVFKLGLAGVQKEVEYRRFYPAAEVAAHVTGFTGVDDNGQEGMELAFDEWLAGKEGRKHVLKDLKGDVIRDLRQIETAKPGNDLALSIDLRLQYIAYRELKAAVMRHGAKSGSVVVLDSHSGEVLAMANQPSFNPNDRSQLKPEALRNRAITDVFEPGSTVKPLTILAALESGEYKPHTKINTAPGYIRVGSKTLVDPVNYGEIDVTKVITKSSQVGTSKIALSMEPDFIRDMFQRVGLGEMLGTGFPGEGMGMLPARRRWAPIEHVNLAFGYGVSLTALQLAQAYSVIANEGNRKAVSLIRQEEPALDSRVVNANIVRDVKRMLQTVTGPKGTAKRAMIPAYSVAGKTGTVHKVGANGYSDDRYISLFAGFAPVNNPRIVAVVVVNEPTRGGYYGGEVAAPVFANIAAGAMRLLDVPPESDAKNKTRNKAPLKRTVLNVSSSNHGGPLS